MTDSSSPSAQLITRSSPRGSADRLHPVLVTCFAGLAAWGDYQSLDCVMNATLPGSERLQETAVVHAAALQDRQYHCSLSKSRNKAFS